MELLGDTGHIESRFDLFRDSADLDADSYAVCGERTLGSETVLDAPNGTPT